MSYSKFKEIFKIKFIKNGIDDKYGDYMQMTVAEADELCSYLRELGIKSRVEVINHNWDISLIRFNDDSKFTVRGIIEKWLNSKE